jgi:predicted RNase H-like HicB family nuclease
MKAENYTYQVVFMEDENEFLGLCLEFPGLSAFAETEVEAFTEIRKVVQTFIDWSMEENDSLPVPFGVVR